MLPDADARASCAQLLNRTAYFIPSGHVQDHFNRQTIDTKCTHTVQARAQLLARGRCQLGCAGPRAGSPVISQLAQRAVGSAWRGACGRHRQPRAAP
jgi:hypothetical protein